MNNTRDKSLRIGIIATRLAGTDGVSLETMKWVHVMEQLGHHCFFLAGEANTDPERTRVARQAHFLHPEIREVNNRIFEKQQRDNDLTRRIHSLKRDLKEEISRFRRDFKPDWLIAENILSLPVHLPLGLALAEHLSETGTRCIAHHHDFWWERHRFLGSPAEDLLRAAFPATSPNIRHVVINSIAQRQIAYRAGLPAHLIPNVMDFHHPPPPQDRKTRRLREDLDIPEGNLLLLQPTRIVPRKRIEKTLELSSWLDRPNTVLVTHDAGDEGNDYLDYLKRLADALKVDFRAASRHFEQERRKDDSDSTVFSLADAYACADLVTYPSRVEGFGNAFLETIYHKRPLVMNAYEIYRVDICPKGFRTMQLDNFPSRELIREVRDLLDSPDRVRGITEANFELGKRHFSYGNLETCLTNLLRT